MAALRCVNRTNNLAAGRPASQSSNFGSATAGRAVDGDTNGNFSANSVTHTQSTAGAWWQVDLGTTQNLGQVVIYNRTDCCAERLANFAILVSNDGNAWTTVGANPGAAPARSVFTISASGRYVRVQLLGTNFLSLAEVQVHAADKLVTSVVSNNLAAGRPTSQSSNFGSATAGRAVDGDTNGNFSANSVTHTESTAGAWWQVDLGTTQQRNMRVIIYNRTDCCAERLANFAILVSNDGNAWTKVATNPGAAPVRSDFDISTSGRYVRVQLLGTNFLSLAEVQVFEVAQAPTPQYAAQQAAAVVFDTTFIRDSATNCVNNRHEGESDLNPLRWTNSNNNWYEPQSSTRNDTCIKTGQ